MEKIYTEPLIEIFNRVKSITAEQLEVDIDEIQLDSSLRFIDDLDAIELIMAIEQEFDIEVPDEIEIDTIEELVGYIINRVIDPDIPHIPNSEIKKILDPQNLIARKALKVVNLIESLHIDEETLLNLLENNDFIYNYEIIRKITTILDKPKTHLSEILEFTDIFRNEFLVSHLEKISQVVSFLDALNINYGEASRLIRDGHVKSHLDYIESWKQSIHQTQMDLQNKLLDLHDKKCEMQTVQSEVQTLTCQVNTLKKQLESYLLNGNAISF